MTATTPVLDSDVLIDYLRGAGPGRELVAAMRETLAFRITAVTALELASGAPYARNPAPVDALLAAPCLRLDRAAGVRAGQLMRDLRDGGETLDVRDAMQAAICIEQEAQLVTRNTRHFARVPELALVPVDRALRSWRSA